MSETPELDSGRRPQPSIDTRHGALMDAVYRRQRYIYDATRKFFLLGRDRLLDELRPGPGQSVLEVGCGTGRNLVVAARRYPQAQFYGLDISEMMLETAQAKIRRAGLSHRITLAQGDAAAFSTQALFGRSMDRVFLSYALSMIPPWRQAIAEGLAALTPEGSLHVVDFGQQERLPRLSRALLRHWLARFHVEPRAELSAALAEAAAECGRQATLRPLYRGYAWLGRVASELQT